MSGAPPKAASAADWVAFFVPVAYLLVVFVMEPTTRLQGYGGWPPRRHRLVFDDYDMAAYALRGLNAAIGRPPGAVAPPPELTEAAFARRLAEQSTPLPAVKSPYFLEYPVVASWLFRLAFLPPNAVRGVEFSPALLDGWHNNVVEHGPQDARQRRVWAQLRTAIRVYRIVGIACLVGLMAVTRCGYLAGGGLAGPVWLLALPACLYFSANRFDSLPALVLALGLAGLGRGRYAISGTLVAAATLVKVYPLLVAVLAWRFVGRSGFVRWWGAFVATVAIVLCLSAWQYGWAATLAPYQYQLGRTADSFGLVLYGRVLPAALAQNSPLAVTFRLGVVGGLTLVLALRPAGGFESLLRRSAIVLIVFASLQTFYSPQWILWVMPFLAPLAARRWALTSLAAALDLVTYATFPVVCDLLGHPSQGPWMTELVYARLGIISCLLAVLLADELKPTLWRHPSPP